jgi:hypothetical protein
MSAGGISLIPAAIGAVGSFFTSQAGANAQEDAARQAGRLGKPLLEMQAWALPQLRGLVESELIPALREEPPELRAAHETAVRDIERGTGRATSESDWYWGRAGNLGRGRGERARIARAGGEALGEEAIRYGTVRTAQKQSAQQNLINTLTTMSNLGSAAFSPAMAALSMGAAARSGQYSDIAGILGDVAGTVMGAQQARLEREFWKQINANTKRRRTTGGVQSDTYPADTWNV